MELSIIEKNPDVNYDLLSTDDSDIILDFDTKEKTTDCTYLTEGIGELSNQFRPIKVLIIFILLNPFIRLLLTMVNRKYFNGEAFDTLLSKEERHYTNIFTILILLMLNLMIIFMVHDLMFRVILFLLNNIYLLLFTIQIYKEDMDMKNTKTADSYINN
jgi:hypothetical protein